MADAPRCPLVRRALTVWMTKGGRQRKSGLIDDASRMATRPGWNGTPRGAR
jgi:hypothetical protein